MRDFFDGEAYWWCHVSLLVGPRLPLQYQVRSAPDSVVGLDGPGFWYRRREQLERYEIVCATPFAGMATWPFSHIRVCLLKSATYPLS